ncbi:hypothetical protein LTR86_009611 [Recurvomyces mirabilis]|nr:hypothetical protein LTR86_009611 [Recurvomyces mirabilis]
MSLGLAGNRLWIAVTGGVLLIILAFASVSTYGKAPSLRLKAPGSRAGGSGGSLQDVHNATLGFQKIYAINLPSRTDHRDSISLAAHLTGLRVDYWDGVTSLESKTLPPGGDKFTSKGALFAWRAHMNLLRHIVENNITTALIAEDDIDWDIRIKSQMEDYARASRVVLQTTSSGPAGDYYDADYTSAGDAVTDYNVVEHPTTEPTSSPYGDVETWDVFWLGHCGVKMPTPSDNLPTNRAVIYNDPTVPETQHIDAEFGDRQLVDGYPNHTRIVSHAHDNVCSLAYAISLPGARKILYELGIKRIDRAFDLALTSVCGGTDGRPRATCLSVMPQIFAGYHPIALRASLSDIGTPEHGDEYTTVAFSKNIRWSTRGNFEQLVYGRKDYTDTFRDGEPKPDLGE